MKSDEFERFLFIPNAMGLNPWFRRHDVQFFSSYMIVVLLVSNYVLNKKGKCIKSPPFSKISRNESL